MVLDTGRGGREQTLEDLVARAQKIAAAIESVIDGKAEAVRLALTVLLAEGHLLLEDVPGVGKTTLAKALAASLDAAMRADPVHARPAARDITGRQRLRPRDRRVRVPAGAGVFANVVLADEINRASPKTQSALLEAMQERQVTVDGGPTRLPAPFLVIATQNPVEHGGHLSAAGGAARPVPAARSPSDTRPRSAEMEMLDTHGSSSPLDQLKPVATATDVRELILAVRGVPVSKQVKDYIIALAAATRGMPNCGWGRRRVRRCTCCEPAAHARRSRAGTT